jgi:hypothetical protein
VIAVYLNVLWIARIARAGEEERALSLTEDEQLTDLVP